VEVDGTAVTLTQTTDYPWDGAIGIRVDPAAPADFALRLRIPGWCRSASLTVNGEAVDLAGMTERGYAQIRRRWRAGDQVSLKLDMPAERVRAHPDVRADQGRVALKRGPIVYCLEAVDNAAPLHRILLPRTTEIAPRFEPGLLGGVSMLTGVACAQQVSDGALYRSEPAPTEAVPIKAVPYHAWDHREPGEMLVWLPEV
jgi:DUF1680 family protein